MRGCIWQSSLNQCFTCTYQDDAEAPEVAGLVVSGAVEELWRCVLQGEAGGLQRRTAAPRGKQPREPEINHLQHRVIRLIRKQHVLPEEEKKRGTMRDTGLCTDTVNHKRLCTTAIWHPGTADLIMMHRDVLRRAARIVLEAAGLSDGWKISFREKSHWWRLMWTVSRLQSLYLHTDGTLKFHGAETNQRTVSWAQSECWMYNITEWNQANYERWSHSWWEIWMRERDAELSAAG